MPVPPANPYTNTAKPARKVKILLGDQDGSEASDEVTYLKLLRIHRSNGGRHLDYAEFEYDLGATGERIENHLVQEQVARQVEVWLLDDQGNADQLLFWGELLLESITLDRGESLRFQASVQPWHFGNICEGMNVKDPNSGDIVTVNEDPVFQPLIDGKIENNMSTELHDEHLYRLWIDPESVRTTEARTLQDASAEEWTLVDVIDSLQWMLNPDEEFIENAVVLPDDPIFEDAPTVRNLHLRRGAYLPQYLDDILLPYGYGWYLGLGTDPDNASIRKIVIFKQGTGTERMLYLQPLEETLDLAKTNTEQTKLDTDIADLANVIVGQGSFQQRQVTLPLERGWEEDDDELDVADLVRSDPGSQFATKKNVWRLFVGNEDGSYNGLRDEITAAPDLSSVLVNWIPRRQKLGSCLTLEPRTSSETGIRMRPVLEWSSDSGASWAVVPDEWGYQILQDRVGIYFTGDEVPEEIRFAADEALLRITGTLTGPYRVQQTATKQSTSPQRREVKLFLDLSDRFHDRAIQLSGEFRSESPFLADGVADTRDDSDELLEFLEAAREIEDAAGMTASFGLHGIHLDYQIGELLTRIDGRDIFLDRKSVGAETKRYLQMTGIIFDWQQQGTMIEVEAEAIGELDRKLNRAALT